MNKSTNTLDDELDEIVLKPATWQLDDYIKAKSKLQSILKRECIKAKIDEHRQFTRMARDVTKYKNEYVIIPKSYWTTRLATLSNRLAQLNQTHKEDSDGR